MNQRMQRLYSQNIQKSSTIRYWLQEARSKFENSPQILYLANIWSDAHAFAFVLHSTDNWLVTGSKNRSHVYDTWNVQVISNSNHNIFFSKKVAFHHWYQTFPVSFVEDTCTYVSNVCEYRGAKLIFTG